MVVPRSRISTLCLPSATLPTPVHVGTFLGQQGARLGRRDLGAVRGIQRAAEGRVPIGEG